MSRRRFTVLAILLFVLPPGVARADDATLEEVRRLAIESQNDAGALERLRSVTSIDGVPVDMESLLAGDSLDARLDVLAALPASSGTSPGPDIRAQADRLRSQHTETRPAAPVDDPNARDAVVEEVVEESSRSIGDLLGMWQVWLIIGLVVAALVFGSLVSSAGIGSRERLGRAGGRGRGDADDGRTDFERDADEAERAGEYSAAVRLRFRAGLSRLEESGLIRGQDVATSGSVRAVVSGPVVDDLTATYDRVAYGDYEAEPTDATAARDGWTEVLAGVGVRRG